MRHGTLFRLDDEMFLPWYRITGTNPWRLPFRGPILFTMLLFCTRPMFEQHRELLL